MSGAVEVVCDECGSPFHTDCSNMAALCPECAHLLYGYPPCAHVFVEGRCRSCGWNGARSPYIENLVRGPMGGTRGPFQWNTGRDGALTLEAVRASLNAANRFRVGQHLRTAGTHFPEWLSVPMTCYVIAGRCCIESERSGEHWDLRAGQFIGMPPGRYRVRFPEDTRMIKAHEIPAKYRRKT